MSPDLALRAVSEMSARYSMPARTVDEVLDTLVSRYGMAEAVELLRAVM